MLPGAHEGLGALPALVWGCSLPPDLSAVQGEVQTLPQGSCRSSGQELLLSSFLGREKVLQAQSSLQHPWMTEGGWDLDNFKSNCSVTSSRYCNKTSLCSQGQANTTQSCPWIGSFSVQQKGKEKKEKCFHAVHLLKSHSKVCFDFVSLLPPAWPYSFMFLSLGLVSFHLKLSKVSKSTWPETV